MNEREIFIEALRIRDSVARASYLDDACNRETRERIEILLSQDEVEESFFLDAPVAIPATIDMPRDAEFIGMKLGPYKLLQRIGEGGFGVVYMAEQHKPVRRKVALKVIKPGMDSKEVIARFEAERQALALMEHANIAKVLDAGATAAGRPYFVMELVRGVPMTEFCDEQVIATRDRLRLFVDICRAIQHAHQKGVIHRDLKPTNILVTLDDDRPVPKVIDFGISKALSHQLTEKTLFTAYGQMVGTPLYMAPEQAQMSMRDVDTRSDVYSLGVLLYELLTGSTPFDKETLHKSGFEEMRRIIQEVDPPRPSARISTLNAEALSTVSDKRKVDPRKLSQSLRGELDWIVMKALEKDRNRRYESASAFAADVERYLADEPVLARPASLVYRFGKFARRKKATLSAVLLVVVFFAVISAGIGWVSRDRSARRARATENVERIIDDAESAMEAQNWSQAWSLTLRAESVLEGGDVENATESKFRKLIEELKLVRQLEELRAAQSQMLDSKSNHPESTSSVVHSDADTAYARAFKNAGLNVEGVGVEQAAAQIRRYSRVAPVIAMALADWAHSRQVVEKKSNGSSWRRLFSVANAIDPDPWRTRFRTIWAKKGPRGKEQLRKLARSPELRKMQPGTLALVSMLISSRLSKNEAAEFLLKVQPDHPNDFWINFHLAGYLGKTTPKQTAESIVYYRIALGIRPDSKATLINVGIKLTEEGRHDEAVRFLRKAANIGKPDWRSHKALGWAFEKMKKYAEAALHFQKSVALRPDANMHNNLATCLERTNQLEAAIAETRKAINLAPRKPLFQVNLGILLGKTGRSDLARIHFQRALDTDPDFASAHRALGVLLYDEGEKSAAFKRFKRAIQLDPKYVQGHLSLAAAFEGEGRLDEASRSYQKVIKLDASNIVAHFRLGVVRGKQGKREDAIRCYRRTIQLNPIHASAHNELGNQLAAQRKFVEAAGHFEQAVKLSPTDVTHHHNLGLVYKQLGKKRRAISCFKKAIECDQRDKSSHLKLGVLLSESKQFDAAIFHLRKVIEIDPKLAYAQNALGFTIASQGRERDAIPFYRKAIELEPTFVLAHVNLGIVLSKLGKRKEAIVCFQRAVTLEPDTVQWHRNLGHVLFDEGRYEESAASYLKVTQLDSKDWESFYDLGRARLNQGVPAKAVAAFKKAIALRNDVGSVHLILGFAYRRIGNPEKAMAAIKRSLELNRAVANRLHDDRGTRLRLFLSLMNLSSEYSSSSAIDLRDTEDAIQLATEATRLRKKDARGWITLAEAHYRNGEFAKCEQILIRMRKVKKPRLYAIRLRILMAMSRWRRGGHADARKQLAFAIQLTAKRKLPALVQRLFDEANQLIQIKSDK